MAALKKQLKNILGLASISVLLISVTVGILIKEINNPKVSFNQSVNRDYQLEDHTSRVLNAEVEQSKKICSDFFEEDENTFVLSEYSKVEVIECMSVGCGGIF